MIPEWRITLKIMKENIMVDRNDSYRDGKWAPEQGRMSGPTEDMASERLSCL